ncbi:unnamed protein product [Caenorhabditis sp. 36 PRJEB53466]|nr:unnamed protein product [Caenorhabditis sp. 36 PRJEB53466]
MGFRAIKSLTDPFLQLHEWDNGAERIVHTTTMQILLFFCFMLSSNLLFGQPITCLMMPETPDSSANYFHDFCFYQDKLRIPNQGVVKRTANQGMMSVNQNAKEEVAVTYYQWTPFIILLQVAMCLLPAVIWKFFGLYFFYGKDFSNIVHGLVSKEDDEKIGLKSEDYDVDAVKTRRWLQLKKRERFGTFTTMTIYVSTKWLTFISLLFQFYMMARIYASGELLWGVHISYDLLNGVYKNIFSGVFPQIVGCKTHRAQMGGVVNEFIMRCILPQNFINSKAFLFLYWWYILAMLVSLFSAVQFTVMLFVPRYQRYSTKSLLPTQEFFFGQAGSEQRNVIPGDSDPYEFFIDSLGNDGYLLLQCSSVPLSVVAMRCFSSSLYRIIVLKSDEYEGGVVKLKKPVKSPVDYIEFDGGGDRLRAGKCEKNKQKFIDNDLAPLIDHAMPSTSSESNKNRYSPAPGKCHVDSE